MSGGIVGSILHFFLCSLNLYVGQITVLIREKNNICYFAKHTVGQKKSKVDGLLPKLHIPFSNWYPTGHLQVKDP